MAVEPYSSEIAEMATLLADAQHRGSRQGRDTLSEIIDGATRAVPGAQYAGLTMSARRKASATSRRPIPT